MLEIPLYFNKDKQKSGPLKCYMV